MTDVKTCDLCRDDAVELLSALNPGMIRYIERYGEWVIVIDADPGILRYPIGWYYAKGCYRNKHNSTTGIYIEVPMINSKGQRWED